MALEPNLAIVHDFLLSYGGAERVVECFHELFPDAPVYTLAYNDKAVPQFKGCDVRTSFAQHFPFIKIMQGLFLPFYPAAIESLDLSRFDVILSSSYAFAKNVRKRKGQIHVCYCYTPMRFAHIQKENSLIGAGLLKRFFVKPIIEGIAGWDKSSENVDSFVSISETVRARIKRVYGSDSTVINPPVDTRFFKPGKSPGSEYFLLVARLVPYKRVDVAVRAFNELGLPLKIVGSGPMLSQLKKVAKPNIEFLKDLSDGELLQHYQNCKAFVFPAEEDFGIAPVEAMSCGKPVIAFGKGGCLETVVEGKTGHFFYEQTAEALVRAVKKFDSINFSPKECRKQARKFDKGLFKKRLSDFVANKFAAGLQ